MNSTPLQSALPPPRRATQFAPLCALLLALLASTEFAAAEVRRLTVSLSGKCAGTSSSASGTGTFLLDTDSGDVTYEIALTGIPALTEYHIHGPAEACTIARIAPPLVVLPRETDVSGSFNLDPQRRDLMLTGYFWVMAHTEQWTAGEILGRILADCPGDCSGNGVCDLGSCDCDPGWAGADCSQAVTIPAASTWGLIVLTGLLLSAGALMARMRRPLRS